VADAFTPPTADQWTDLRQLAAPVRAAKAAPSELRRAEEARYDRLKAEWDQLPAAERAAIEQAVRARFPLELFQRFDPIGTLRACLRELELRGKPSTEENA
jgi:hypothetical protein